MSLPNFWTKRLPTLRDHLGVPFGDEVVCNDKPAELLNKRIDYNKNEIVNLPAGQGGSGEANTSSNVGTGEGQLAKAKEGVNLPFKTLKQGANITITNNTDDVTIEATGGGTIPDATTEIKGKVELAEDNENLANVVVQGNDTRLSNARTPTAHTHVKIDITDFSHTHTKSEITDFSHTHVKADVTDFAHTHTKSEITDFTHTHVKADITDFTHTHVTADITDFPDVGEDNTGANVGTGQGNVFRNKTGVTLNLKTIKGGTNVTVTDNTDDITIAASSGGGGEANTTSNEGTGEGTLALAKDGINLPFKTLKQGSNITLTNNAQDVTISATGGGGGEANTSSNVGTGDGLLAKPKEGVNLPFKSIKDGTNVDVVNNTDDVTINVPDASTTVKGAVELATDGESAANLAVQSNDIRMSNARTPTAHTHIKSEITDFSHTHVKADVTDFSHTHVKADITDFTHTHTKSEITDFTHTHVKADITDFAHSHLAADLPDASTTGKGIVQLATDGESNANEVCVSNDSRLSNARTPTTHTHVKADITDFSHTHTKSEITDFSHSHVETDLPDATTTGQGVVELATDGESAANVAVQGNDSRLSNSRAPTGNAGGDLAGSTYPDPTIANDAVTYAKIQNVAANNSLLGRISGANGNIEELTATQGRTLLGITSENVGTASGAANGSATVFNIAHSLGTTPYMALVIVSSVLGSTIDFSYTYDATNIVVTFASAPSTGTITFQWRAVA